MKIAVTGGTGLVGSFIVNRLLKRGYQVRLMVRPGGTAAPKGVETSAAELDPESDYRDLLQGADALVHAAFHHQAGRYRGGEGSDLEGFLNKNVAGSLALLAQARDTGIARAIVLSSRAVYGRQMPGAVLSEDMAIDPDSHYGAAKAALEAFAASFSQQDNWPVCVLRPTGVYGLAAPIEKSKWFGLVRDCLAGRTIPVRGGTEVHGGDVAEAVMQLLQADEAEIAGKAFNCSDFYVSTRAIATIVQSCSGRDIALPAQPTNQADYNVMNCDRLKQMGMAFAGERLLEQTIAALTAHHLKHGV